MAEASSSKTFRDKMDDIASRRGARCHIQRIEDKLTPGVFDMFVCFDGRDFAVETKHIKELPARDSTIVKFDEPMKPEQKNWGENRQIAGGRSFVVVRAARVGWYVFDHFRDIDRTFTRAEWDKLDCFLTAESLINHLLSEIDNDQQFGRPLFRGRHHQKG